ncbi:Crp/Fnr family transcriptional regulator [Cereibacter sphaeroides]|uniref:Crp/Fnr family transcriptional regulator n=1 Tax=Cereibacter sphaeroides TaxID=1063 RepID=UPI001F1A8977|nr:Crp/Fnr family transcriptional regulator [Cereibacter sphaeroides]MCE6959634.1 Crp/Fnr family transcriptional regulator [Cereibacter sphaeroides]MCE6974505.1 Crp/Fnr family transcriptional regulator [Cereibacter sphaeroides]
MSDDKGNCLHCPTRLIGICSHSSRAELNVMQTMRYYRSYAPGEVIARAGDPMNFLATIKFGMVTVSRTAADGHRQMVGLLQPGDFIGQPFHPVLMEDVVAAGDALLCIYPRKTLETFLQTHPGTAIRLMEMVYGELDLAREWMVILSRLSAREKVASFLALVARRQRVNPSETGCKACGVDLPISRTVMGEYLGLGLSTVSRQMNDLKSEGIIAFSERHRIIIKDMPQLLKAAGNDGRETAAA